MAKKKKVAKKIQGPVRSVAPGDPRVVTPDDPLIISQTPAVFPDVEIAGGFISTTVETDVTFGILTKTS